jgi:hypothetical protein
MNIIAYRMRHNEPMAPPRARRSGEVMKPEVDRTSPWVRGHVVPPDPVPLVVETCGASGGPPLGWGDEA